MRTVLWCSRKPLHFDVHGFESIAAPEMCISRSGELRDIVHRHWSAQMFEGCFVLATGLALTL